VDAINKRILSPWWFLFWVAGLFAAGYISGGKIAAIEGAVIALVLAHGALLEFLREEREQKEMPDDRATDR